jgi:RimJ/RimL family protein N-acetyltransferase
MNGNTQLVDRAPSDVAVAHDLDNIHYRRIRSDDWHRLQLFHQRLSRETVALRFHGAKRELSEPLAHRFTQLDGRNDAAFVATTGTRGRIIGVARYSRIGAHVAEVAFVIEDGFQHHHVGHRLMQHLRQTAREQDITEFLAEVLPGNLPMLHLLQEAGAVTQRCKCGVLKVYVDLTTPQPR